MTGHSESSLVDAESVLEDETGIQTGIEMGTTTAIAAVVDRLSAARAARRPCPPVRGLLPAGDIDAAYAVQTAWVDRQIADGALPVGRKIGLTNPVVQAQLGVDWPDFGVLLDTMAALPGTPIDTGRTLQPRIEAEIAFVLARDLDQPASGSAFTSAEVAAATDYVVAALEIVDSRIAGWDIDIVDTVADNASSGLFTLGGERQRLDGLDLASCPMTMCRGEEVVSTGSGAACLGDPLNAVAWLATTARAYGRPLRAGEVVLSGALGPMVAVSPGDSFHARIDGLGEIRATFAGTAGAAELAGTAGAAELAGSAGTASSAEATQATETTAPAMTTATAAQTDREALA